jgi:hypothetical protein
MTSLRESAKSAVLKGGVQYDIAAEYIEKNLDKWADNYARELGEYLSMIGWKAAGNEAVRFMRGQTDIPKGEREIERIR